MAAAIAVLLLCALIGIIAIAYRFGYINGRTDERNRASELTGFAAWIFHQLWIAPEGEWHRLKIRRGAARYRATFDHQTLAADRTVTHTDGNDGNDGTIQENK